MSSLSIILSWCPAQSLACTRCLLSLLLSCPVKSKSLWPHRLQLARPACPSPSPGVCPSSLRQWCYAVQPSHPLTPSSPSAFSIFPGIRGFSNESFVHIRWPKYWSFSFSINPSSEYSGLISLKIDWFDLVQGTSRSLLQHHSLKASILWCSAFFTV